MPPHESPTHPNLGFDRSPEPVDAHTLDSRSILRLALPIRHPVKIRAPRHLGAQALTSLSELDADIARLTEKLQRAESPLTPNTTFLHSAKWYP